MANTDQGVDLLAELVYTLNDIITSTGQAIDINNDRIWRDHLHRYTNEDWDSMLAALQGLAELQPDLFAPFHNTAIAEARWVIDTQGPQQPRVLDHKNHKRKAWRVIMAAREVINKFNGVDIPNRDQVLRRSATTRDEVFEQDE